MKKIIWLLVLIILTSSAFASELVLFYGDGCPYCAKMETFLNNVSEKYPNVKIKSYEVYNNVENQDLFDQYALFYKKEIDSIPTIYIGDKVFTGYSEDVTNALEEELFRCNIEECNTSIFQNIEISVDKPSTTSWLIPLSILALILLVIIYKLLA